LVRRQTIGNLAAALVAVATAALLTAPGALAASVMDQPIDLGNLTAPPAASACHGASGWYCRPAAGGSGRGSGGSVGASAGVPAGGGTGGGGQGAGAASGVAGGGPAPGAGGAGAGGAQTAGGGATPSAAAGLSSAETEMLSLMNRARAALALPTLAVNPTLQALAETRAQDMARLGYITHDLPGLGLPAQMESQAGYLAQAMGAEDIAEAGSVPQAFAMFRGSPTHWANITYPAFTQAGVAVVPTPYGVIVDILFSGPSA
jgi:hypothetical protein